MTDVDNIIQHAEQYCTAHGIRLTAKRRQVLAGLIQSNKALSAYELVNFCKKHYGKSISAMSAYRILEFLENEHLVHKLNLANKYVACTRIGCDHAHDAAQFLICGKCGKVKEISIKPSMITDLKVSVEKAGFKLASSQLEMNCLCNDCSTQAA